MSQAHNRRDPEMIAAELRNGTSQVDLHGIHETWTDIEEAEAYRRIFGDALERYNTKQQRADRRIEDYHASILADKKRHPAYEIYMCIGNTENRPDPEISREILQDYVRDFGRRNSNLKVIGAYYHADEPGIPHVHLDFIPVGHGYKRGLDTQVSLNRALEEQGITYIKRGATAQIIWENKERMALDRLATEHGLDIIHPEAGKHRPHFSKEVYIEKKEQHRKTQELEDIVSQMKFLLKDLSEPDTTAIVKIIPAEPERKSFTGKIIPAKPECVVLTRNDYEKLVSQAQSFVDLYKQGRISDVFERFVSVDKRLELKDQEIKDLDLSIRKWQQDVYQKQAYIDFLESYLAQIPTNDGRTLLDHYNDLSPREKQKNEI